VRRYEIAAGWQPAADGQPGLDLAAYIGTLPNRSAHGEAFAYRSILTDVLAMVLEGASAERFADAMSGLVWSRMGAEHDAEITVDRHGNAMSDGGISVTLRDLARFGQLYLLGGSLSGQQVLPAAWVADTRFADEACRGLFLASLKAARAMWSPAQQACAPRGHYRNQWWVLDPGAGIMMGSGIYGQYVYVDAARDVVLAKLSSLPRPLDPTIAARTSATAAADEFVGWRARCAYRLARHLQRARLAARALPVHLRNGRLQSGPDANAGGATDLRSARARPRRGRRPAPTTATTPGRSRWSSG
jgi:CubicO group peptidase (beta-lactamase class C family)